jgi:hypothetical protein
MLERAEVARARGAQVLAEIGEVTAPTAVPSPAGRGWCAPRAPGEAPLGAHFALLLAGALGELSDAAPVTVEYTEGNRAARALLSKPSQP